MDTARSEQAAGSQKHLATGYHSPSDLVKGESEHIAKVGIFRHRKRTKVKLKVDIQVWLVTSLGT